MPKCAVCVVAATEITIRSPQVHPGHHRKERIVLDFAGYAELLGAVADPYATRLTRVEVAVRRLIDAIATGSVVCVVGIGHVIEPPIHFSNRARGTRNCRPSRMTGTPLAPPVARDSPRELVRLATAEPQHRAASSTVKKSGTRVSIGTPKSALTTTHASRNAIS